MSNTVSVSIAASQSLHDQKLSKQTAARSKAECLKAKESYVCNDLGREMGQYKFSILI